MGQGAAHGSRLALLALAALGIAQASALPRLEGPEEVKVMLTCLERPFWS